MREAGRPVLCRTGAGGYFPTDAKSPSNTGPTPAIAIITTNAPHSDQKRLEFGGVIYTESAEKAARFIAAILQAASNQASPVVSGMTTSNFAVSSGKVAV